MDETKVGKWQIIFAGPVGLTGEVLSSINEGVHMNLVHQSSGKWLVLLYSGFKKPNDTDPDIKTSLVDLHPPLHDPPLPISVHEINVPNWDHASWTTTHENPYDQRGRIFCSGHVMRANGTLIVVGGHRIDVNNVYPYGYQGLPTTYVYEPNGGSGGYGSWSHLNDGIGPLFMVQGRWYPTVTRLGDDYIIVVSGWEYDFTSGNQEIFNSRVERFPGPDGKWEVLKDRNDNELVLPFSELYPGAHLIPFNNSNHDIQEGEIYYTMPMKETWRLNVHNEGAPDPDFNSVNERTIVREHGNSVMLTIILDQAVNPTSNMKVLLLGGFNGTEAVSSTEMLDLATTGSLKWLSKAPLKIPRFNCNSVILPDKRLFVIGGNHGTEKRENCVTIPELYDPYALNGFGYSKMLIANTYQRMYHSTAILTPDGTVLISGGELPNTLGNGIMTMEVYSPPYLFFEDTHPKPTIVTNVTDIYYGTSFTITKTQTIISVMLIRFGCPTHAFDQDQRAIELFFSQSSNTITITPPPTLNIAPKGKYMLFILRDGPTDPDTSSSNSYIQIPSLGKIVNLS